MFFLAVLVGFAAAALPLQHVKSFMSPMSAAEWATLSRTGRFDREIDEIDALFGRTRATLRARFDAAQFSLVDESDDAAKIECVGGNAVRFASDEVAVGDVVVGANLCGFCNAHAVGDDMSAHACVARVAALAHDGAATLEIFRDVWSLVESVDVDFVHVPGNDSAVLLAEAARRRGEPLTSADPMPLQFDVLQFNFDKQTRGAKENLTLDTLSDLFGVPTTCSDCFAALTAGVEFSLRVSLNGVGVPTVHAFKLVLFGDLQLSTVFTTTLPLSRELSWSFPFLKVPLSPAPLVIPLGLLAIKVQPALELELQALATLSNPIALSFGFKQTSSIRAGAQLVAGESGVQLVRSASQENNVVARLTGFAPSDLQLQSVLGVQAKLELGVGLTLLPLVLLPLKPMVNVGIAVTPQFALTVKPPTAPTTPACALPLVYEVGVGMRIGVDVSPLTIDVGFTSFELTLGARLPYAVEFDAVPLQAPPGCAACTGCLGAIDKLAGLLLKNRGPVAVAPPLPPSAAAGEALVVTTSAAAVAIGAPLTIQWNYDSASSSSVASVTIGVEVRRLAANNTNLQTVLGSSEQLDKPVPFGNRKLQLAALQPFTSQVLLPGTSKVRFVVVSTSSDDVFGKSAWLDVLAPTATGAPTRIFSRWGACNAPCGARGTQTRTAVCVSGDGARTVACSAAQTNAAALTRPCVALRPDCPFVPFSFIAPTPNNVQARWAFKADYADITLEFNGGQIGKEVVIHWCYFDVDPCTKIKPQGCKRMLSVLPNSQGSTSVDLELGALELRYSGFAKPVLFSILLDGGGDQWALSPSMMLRPPEITYAFDGAVTAVSGVVSVASALGSVTLQPSRNYRRTAIDIGQPSVISFNLVRAGAHYLLLRIEPPGVLARTWEIQDRRSSKVPGFVVAQCVVTETCYICDKGDSSCAQNVQTLSFFAQKLPRQCAGPAVAPTAPVPMCGTSGIAGQCLDVRRNSCKSPQRWLTRKCPGDANIKCCATAESFALLGSDEDVWDGELSEAGSAENVGAIVGGVVGAVVFVLLVVLIAVWWLRRRSTAKFDHVVVANEMFHLK